MAELSEQEQKIEQLQKDYQQVFGGEAGKRVLEDLKAIGFYRTTTFAGDPDNALVNEGSRRMVLHIISMIELDPKELRDLVKMAQGKIEEDDFAE